MSLMQQLAQQKQQRLAPALPQTRASNTGPALSEQQRAIIAAPLGGMTFINAYAGTGKTSTLAALAHSHANKRILYLAYNKSAQQEAAQRFGSNTKCTTIHGLAFGSVGRKYAHKLGTPRLRDLVEEFDMGQDWAMARQVLDTILAWCASASFEFPQQALGIEGPLKLHPARSLAVAACAQEVWKLMCDPANPMPMPHDGYLKLYQLSQPRLSFDVVMLDEAQDTNPVTWDVVARQSCPIIVVGDRYQSIYEFRGAVNAMQAVLPDQEFSLTQSWRFGPNIAEIASTLLFGFYGENRPLQGMGGPSRLVSDIDPSKRHCFIARTNAGIFRMAVDAVGRGQSIGFVGGVHNYNFSRIEDVQYLAFGQRSNIRDPFIRGFVDMVQLREYAEQAKDVELTRTIRLADDYGGHVFKLVPQIHAMARPLERAHITLSTAHRSKGLTVDNVRLGEDFYDLVDDKGALFDEEKLDRQEVNLLYVALTRARHELRLNASTMLFLRAMGRTPLIESDGGLFGSEGAPNA